MATAVSTWKQKSTTELMLPSGNTCLVKRSGIETFLKSGRVPNSLMPLMKAALTGNAPKEAAKLEVDEDTINDMFEMFDLVVTMIVLTPKVWPVPADREDGTPAERDDEKLYADEVDLEDKQFIFQWAVGGTADVEKFRQGLASHVAAVQASVQVRDATEPAAGDS